MPQRNESKAARNKPLRRVCWTLNNYTDAEWKALCDHPATSYGIIGKETGDQGTPHLQGYWELKKRTRFNSVKKLLGRRVHLSEANGSGEQNRTYCSKDGDFIEWGEIRGANKGKRNDLEELRQAIREGKDELWIAENVNAYARYPNFYVKYKELWMRSQQGEMSLTLRPWQESLVKIVKEAPHPRTVHWYWDQKGATGKTTLGQYLVRNLGAAYFSSGKYSDMAYAYNYEKIVVLDFARTTADYVPYGFMEQLKNGMLWSPKYQSIRKQFPSPHVVCFANFPPQKEKMSLDRWHVVELINM